MMETDLYFVTKTWPSTSKGVSCAFRNHKANTHCNLLHGYDLVFSVTIACPDEKLSREGWVIDYAALKPLWKRVEDFFDHQTIVAEDDPDLDWYKEGARRGTMSLTILPQVGCEAFATWLAVEATDMLQSMKLLDRCHVLRTQVFEHGSNSAGYSPS
jgi:6-pyruvoyltetrahydropterin/6-carboxytetrahydropterin synthase